MNEQTTKTIYIIGALLTFVGAVCKLFEKEFAPYIFTLGAAILIFLHAKSAYELRDAEIRKKRLSRSALMSGLLLGVAAYSMFTHTNLWVVAILIYSLSTLFVSFRRTNNN
jgi:accessory gene regulator protein AgrB